MNFSLQITVKLDLYATNLNVSSLPEQDLQVPNYIHKPQKYIQIQHHFKYIEAKVQKTKGINICQKIVSTMVQLQNYGINTKKGSQCDVLMCLMTIHMAKNKKKENTRGERINKGGSIE